MTELGLNTVKQTSIDEHILNWGMKNWGGSVAEWLACRTRAQKGPALNRSRNAVG